MYTQIIWGKRARGNVYVQEPAACESLVYCESPLSYIYVDSEVQSTQRTSGRNWNFGHENLSVAKINGIAII